MAEDESAVSPCGRGDQMHSVLCQQKGSQQTQRSDSSPLFGTHETALGCVFSLGLFGLGKLLICGRRSIKSHQDSWKALWTD